MRSQVTVTWGESSTHRFDLDEVQPMPHDQARAWLDEQFTALDCEPIRLTVSIGWAAQTNGETPAESIENTLEQADQALYYAKAQGRNQVVSYAYVAQVCHTPLADNSAPNQHSLATPKAAAC